MILGQLREFSTYQIATILHRHHSCDSDVASIAAWWVFNNSPPKNWSKYHLSCCHFMSRSKNLPDIPKRFVEYILKNYDLNKQTGSTTSLLGKR